MDPIMAEFAKYGVVALSFGILLWATLRDKDRMAAEMNKDKRDLLAAYVAVGNAIEDLRTALNVRPCIKVKPIERDLSSNGG